MTRRPHVVIVGTGFGGLGMALELTRHGMREFTILEQGDEIGGVWRENTYPGAACDIPAPYYSFSFEPNPLWPSRFSRQPDIQAYLKRVVDKYGLRRHIRFGAEVTGARFDERSRQWQVDTAGGERFTADMFVPAVGQLSRPKLPDIPGVGTFDGPAFHSATWDHSVDLAGKRIAVIGTGASAVQFVPEIRTAAAHVTVFQRSAPWIMPRPEVEYKPWHQSMFRRVPLTQQVERFAFWLLCEVLALGLVDLPPMRPVIASVARLHLRRQVPDRALRAAVRPDYAPGCKRALFSGDYLPALAESNVDVVTERITEITTNGVRTADGTLHEVDVIVYGTGFRTTEFLAPITVRGAGDADLSTVWRDGARAYLGIAVPGFPNMFLMYGPNTNLGVGSIIHMLESQARYIRKAVALLGGGRVSTMEVRPEIADRFDRRIQRRLDRSVWTRCSSWYRNEHGRIVNNWPGGVSTDRLATRTLRLEDYVAV